MLGPRGLILFPSPAQRHPRMQRKCAAIPQDTGRRHWTWPHAQRGNLALLEAAPDPSEEMARRVLTGWSPQHVRRLRTGTCIVQHNTTHIHTHTHLYKCGWVSCACGRARGSYLPSVPHALALVAPLATRQLSARDNGPRLTQPVTSRLVMPAPCRPVSHAVSAPGDGGCYL